MCLLLRCSGCDFTFFENFKPTVLKCHFGGGIVNYRRRDEWCHSCRSVSSIEHLPAESEIIESHQEAIQNALRYGTKLFDLELMLAWRRARISLPHCLKCGSTEIEKIDFDPDEAFLEYRKTINFTHYCGGKLVIDFNDKVNSLHLYFESVKIYWLDSEGNKIEEGINYRNGNYIKD